MNRSLTKSELQCVYERACAHLNLILILGFLKYWLFCLGARPSADLMHLYSTNWKETHQSYFTHWTFSSWQWLGAFRHLFASSSQLVAAIMTVPPFSAASLWPGDTLKTMLFGQRFLLSGPSFIFTYGAFLVPEQLYTWLHLERNE